jgi:1-pyrroline-5-carboxylate dehydrogenase
MGITLVGDSIPKLTFENELTYKKFLESGKESEFDSLFDEAATNAKSTFGNTYSMYIAGKEVLSDELLDERSPIDKGILIGRFQKGKKEHAKLAIQAAKAALPEWSSMDYRKRVDIFLKAADLVAKEKFLLAAILSYENGKSRYESIGEVDEAIDFLRYYSIEMLNNKGYLRNVRLSGSKVKAAEGFQGAPSDSERIRIAMRPYGVFGVIAPFNFPVSISVGMSTGALITGNTVVFKPSSTDNMAMLTGMNIYGIFKEAGLPEGVFNIITGPGSELGDELVSNNDVAGIAFTGSRAVGMGMVSKAAATGSQKVFVVEMGGKNPAIISKHADLDKAAKGVASAAFGYAGQKCSALSRIYVHESIKALFISKLIEIVRAFKIGNPLEKQNYVGPLISASALARYDEAVKNIKASGRILYGGNAVNTGLDGCYVEPVIAELGSNNDLFRKELFVPILLVDTFKRFDDAIGKANDTEYGLTAGLYSKKRSEIKEFTGQIQAGTVYVNREVSATTGAIVGLHTFVGWKKSGLTGKGTGSKFYLQQFLREQSVSQTE